MFCLDLRADSAKYDSSQKCIMYSKINALINFSENVTCRDYMSMPAIRQLSLGFMLEINFCAIKVHYFNGKLKRKYRSNLTMFYALGAQTVI